MINTVLQRLSDFIITVVVSDILFSTWERVPDILPQLNFCI